MPVVYRPAGSCGNIFDPVPRAMRGIPLQFFVRPVVRQGGVGQDIPKGFELPTCMVDPCCEDGIPLSLSRTVEVLRECTDTTVNFTIILTNTGETDLTNLTMTPISLAFPGWTILSGDTELVMPATPILAAGASITLLATTVYDVPASAVGYMFNIPAGAVSSDQGSNILELNGALIQLCPAV